MQSFDESGWDWLLGDAHQHIDMAPANALAGLHSPKPMMGGIAMNAMLEPSPKDRPSYLEPWARANFRHELQKPFWTHDELVAVLLGIDPIFARMEEFARNRYKDGIATEGMRLHDLVQRASRISELNIEPSPQEALDWALQRYIHVPPKLLETAAEHNMSLLNFPTQLDIALAECSAQTARLNSEIDWWKGYARSHATAAEDACAKLKERNTKITELQHQLSEAVSQAEKCQKTASKNDDKPKSSSALTREYRTVIKLFYGVVCANYGYRVTSADWRKNKLHADLAEFRTQVTDETLMKHLRAGSEEASR